MPSELEVRCTVSNCYFWQLENFCGADQILITSDHEVSQATQNMQSSGISAMVETPVAASRVTCCQTFQPA